MQRSFIHLITGKVWARMGYMRMQPHSHLPQNTHSIFHLAKRSQIPVLQRMMPFFTRSLGNSDLSMAVSIARIGIYLRLKVINCGFASSRIASDDVEIKAVVYFFRSF